MAIGAREIEIITTDRRRRKDLPTWRAMCTDDFRLPRLAAISYERT